MPRTGPRRGRGTLVVVFGNVVVVVVVEVVDVVVVLVVESAAEGEPAMRLPAREDTRAPVTIRFLSILTNASWGRGSSRSSHRRP